MRGEKLSSEMINTIYIYSVDGSYYPSAEDYYSPSKTYPEYQFDEISRRENHAYDMVRESLHGLELDAENYGKPCWNPLGEIIKEGDNVLIKPNMVKHSNTAGRLDCLITNASILRPIVDYVLIALNGTGKITIGDAPIQSCDFDLLYKAGGFDKLSKFYSLKGIPIAFEDFRGTIAHFDSRGRLIQTHVEESKKQGILVDLKDDSAFSGIKCSDKLRITNYAPQDLKIHHESGKHEYLVSRAALEADVIINVPKPKTHRKAGITGALKNMVGTCVEKEYLPHHMQGSKDEGGDEYSKKDVIKQLRSRVYDRRDTINRKGDYYRVKLYNNLSMLLSACIRLKNSNGWQIQEGNWHGNDTIWRTVLDLNRILSYVDVDGRIHQRRVRKMLTIADMIIVGEGNGPLSPSSYAMGMIIAGVDSINIDKVITSVMGIDYRKIPCVIEAAKHLQQPIMHYDCLVKSNISTLNFDSIDDIDPSMFRHVVMPQGWETL